MPIWTPSYSNCSVAFTQTNLSTITYKLHLFTHHIHTDKHHSRPTCQTVYPQFLHSVADTGWGWLAQRITFCQEQELDLENEVSPTVAQPPGTLLVPTSTTLLTPVHSENDSRVYFMIVLTTDYRWRSWTWRIAVPYKFHVGLIETQQTPLLYLPAVSHSHSSAELTTGCQLHCTMHCECFIPSVMYMPSVLWRCWLGGRKGIRPVKKLVWLSVWSKLQTCIWPSWCHCHSLSLASVKSRSVLPFWYRLTWVVPDKGPLNVCVLNVCVWCVARSLCAARNVILRREGRKCTLGVLSILTYFYTWNFDTYIVYYL